LSQPGNWCHREHLSVWLRGHGVKIRELKTGMLRKRPDAPQPALFDCGEEQA
jgi:hypothetical protein